MSAYWSLERPKRFKGSGRSCPAKKPEAARKRIVERLSARFPRGDFAAISRRALLFGQRTVSSASRN
jgi:hypothetical protein